MFLLTYTPGVGLRAGLISAILLVLISAAAGTVTTAPSQAPGSRVVFDLPSGFEPSRSFTGFVHQPSGATIILLEVPASAYPEMAKGLTPETLSGRGVENARTGTLEREGDYVYLTGEQPSPSGPYSKFIMLFREGAVTALISVSVPKQATESGNLDAQALERALASARMAPEAAAAQKPYVLGYTGPFQETGAFVGQTYFYSTDGALPPPVGSANAPPTLIVSCLMDGRRIADLEAAGRAGLAAFMPGRELKEIQSQRLEVAGLQGVEQLVSPGSNGKDESTGIYQVILLGKEGGYCRILGTAQAEEWPSLRPEFRKIAESFSPHP